MKQSLLEAKSGHKKKKEVMWKNQHEFTNGKSCLTNLIASHDSMNGTVNR